LPVVSSKGLIAFGYACDGNGLGFTDIRTEQNYRSDALGGKGRETEDRIEAVYPLAWSPDGTRLLYKVRLAGDRNLHYYVSRLWPAVRQADTEVVELASGGEVTAAALVDNSTVIVARSIGNRNVVTVNGREALQLPAPAAALVADPGGLHVLIVSATGELWSWTRGEPGQHAVVAPVSAATWLPWS
jgi:hypothetical protein